MLNRLLPLIVTLIICTNAFCQKENNNYNYHIKRATSPIKVDGRADEQAWATCETASDFFQVLPMDTSFAKVITQVKLCYDDKNLYILFINHNFIHGPNMVESMKRDWAFSKNDNDLLFIDTYNDLTTGFSFGSNARGGQWDGLMSGGAAVNLGWDNKWSSEVSYDNEKWVWEAAIPFKTLRYKADQTTWGINFSRLDLKTTEKSAWAPVPRQFPTASLAYAGNLVWDAPPPAPGANISMIPFLYGSALKKREKSNKTEFDQGIGADAKIGISSSLNLDLTVNPDFSQVEVDVQQTNLDRFELFFPERRQFFLENGDIFNNFGSNNIRPFFSRRIGLDAPIHYGAKISGKLDQNWRIGAMNLQTGKNEAKAPGSNFAVLSLQRQVFKRSFVSGMFTNRQTVSGGENDTTSVLPDFNRVAGLEYNLASADNKWNGKAFYLKTFSPGIDQNNNIASIVLERKQRNFTAGIALESVDKDIRGNEIGFIRRSNYYYARPEFSYLFFPKAGFVLSHGPFLSFPFYFSKDTLNKTENTNIFAYNFTLRSQATFMIWTATDYIRLLAPFDPTNYVGANIKANTEHTWHSWGTNFTSKPQSVFTYGFDTRYGGYYADGKRLSLSGEVGYRFQPYAAIALRANYNNIHFETHEDLPEKLRNTRHNFWLAGLRMDVTFSNKVFFTNFVQYNDQTNNLNINARFQWRYSPASDLYVVYTDNYLADSFKGKNRALVLKFTYWWNI